MAQVIAAAQEPRNNRLMLIAALAFAAIAAVLVFAALNNRSGGGAAGVTTTTQEVVVAARGIEVNTLLTADMLEVRSVPVDQVIAGAATLSDAVIGMPARLPIQPGEQITSAKVGVEAVQDKDDISFVIEKGKRAFSIQASEVSAVGGLILPRNYVDVIAVFRDGDVERASTVLQHIEVLSVGQQAQVPVPLGASPGAGDEAVAPQTIEGARGQRPEDVERQPEARSITLAVTPQQAQELAALQTRDGVTLWLSLRAFDDEETVPIDQTEVSPVSVAPAE